MAQQPLTTDRRGAAERAPLRLDGLARTRTKYERFVKRPVDLVGGVVLLLVFSPLLIILAIAVAIALGRPVIFPQRRLTRGAVPFTMYKFRSMKPEEPWDESVLGPRPHHAPEDDPRHTRFGRLIRRLSLDELPQLINVIRGEMSLIGPRPEMPQVAAEHDIVHHPRHLVRPGMTGEWQVSELRAGFVHMSVHLDALYVGDLTFRRDVGIALRTVGLFLGVGPRSAPTSSEAADESIDPIDLEPRPLRVLHVLEPEFSGVPAYVHQLGQELAARGLDQVVLTCDRQTWDFSSWAERVVQVPWRRRPRSVVEVGRAIRHTVADADIDLVHAHATFAGFSSRVRSIDVPVLYQPHGWGHLSTRHPLARTVARSVERVLDSRADMLMVLSDQEAADAPKQRATERVRPIVDLTGFEPLSVAARNRARLEFGWPVTERVLLCVGELSHRKNQIALLRAWGNLDVEGHRLVLVGDGTMRAGVEELATDGVELLGWRDDVHRLMAAADALVVPSLGEGFSLVILEALASGIPVFTTPVGGSEIVLGDDGAVRADAEGVLRAALGSSQLNQPLAARIERSARHVQAASVETVAETFIELYMAAVGRPGVIESEVAEETVGDILQLS
ncbi:MAG: sugar transferase [Acidimicrobiales bacterium]